MSLFNRKQRDPLLSVPAVSKPKPTFEQRLNSIAAEEAYAQDMIGTAKAVLGETAAAAADLALDVDEEVRALFEYKSTAEVLSGRAAFLADSTSENLALVRS